MCKKAEEVDESKEGAAEGVVSEFGDGTAEVSIVEMRDVVLRPPDLDFVPWAVFQDPPWCGVMKDNFKMTCFEMGEQKYQGVVVPAEGLQPPPRCYRLSTPQTLRGTFTEKIDEEKRMARQIFDGSVAGECLMKPVKMPVLPLSGPEGALLKEKIRGVPLTALHDARKVRALGLSPAIAERLDGVADALEALSRSAALKERLSGLDSVAEALLKIGVGVQGLPRHWLEQIFFYSVHHYSLGWKECFDRPEAAHTEDVVKAMKQTLLGEASSPLALCNLGEQRSPFSDKELLYSYYIVWKKYFSK